MAVHLEEEQQEIQNLRVDAVMAEEDVKYKILEKIMNIFKAQEKTKTKLKVNFSHDLTPESMQELSSDKADFDNVLTSKVFQYMLDWIQDEEEQAKQQIMSTFDQDSILAYQIVYRTLTKLHIQLETFYRSCQLAQEELIKNLDSSTDGVYNE